VLLNVRLLLGALVVACCSVVLAQSPAHACKCAGGSVERDAKRADAVFTGTLLEQADSGGDRVYRVEAETLFKGEISRNRVRVVSSARDSCGIRTLESDRPYVFFVAVDGAELRTDQCAGTAPAGQRLLREVEQVLGAGTDLTPQESPEPAETTFTRVEDAEPEELTRLAAPGVALVLLGVLGLLVVRRRSKRA
jgi:hypothetical protein